MPNPFSYIAKECVKNQKIITKIYYHLNRFTIGPISLEELQSQ